MRNRLRTVLVLPVLLCILLTAVNLASGATLHGVVYDYSLEKVDGAHVRLGEEKDITENGEYSFEVGTGKYNITAEYYDEGRLVSSVQESISIRENKTYVLDLVLFESISEGEELFEETDLILADAEPRFLELKVKEGINWFGIVILAVFILLLVYWGKRMTQAAKKLTLGKEEKEEEGERTAESREEVKGEAEKVLDFIRKKQRTTQKDIRKEFPSSEAKISLILAELEHKGKIKKIKKGRGNIIIFQG